MGDQGRTSERTLVRAWIALRVSACAVGLMAEGAAAQTLRGRVVEAVTHDAIEGAAVQLIDPADMTVASGLTGASGTFVLSAPRPGSYRLRVASIGYATDGGTDLDLQGDQPHEVTVRLAVAVIPLSPIAVRVDRVQKLERAGFYDRRQLGQGTFLDRAEIEKRNTMTAGGLLRRIPGFRILTQGGFTDIQSRSTSGMSSCRPGIFVDGSLVSGPRRSVTSFNLEDMGTADLEAVEIYSGAATVPTQYNTGDTACGLVMFWTRKPGT